MKSYILFVSIVLNQLFLSAAEVDVFSDEFIKLINREQNLWKAGIPFGGNSTIAALMTSSSPDIDLDEGEKFSFKMPQARSLVPKMFDARKQWPKCKTLRGVPNQGNCYNCWAAALAVTLSSRLCIQSDGKYDYELSMDHITRCCPVWDKRCAYFGNGCYGGYPNYFFRFWIREGIVSGGYFESNEGCRPYSDDLFFYHTLYPKKNGRPSSTIPCEKSCSNKKYTKPFDQSLMRGKDINYLFKKDPLYIQLEIMNNGPVQATLKLYNDFRVYRRGIYFHRTIPNEKYDWHFVMILGWGEENGVKYWLACNTWGRDWGLGGYFKIKRGNNECEIESRVYGPSFGFGKRSLNKTLKLKKMKDGKESSSSMVIRSQNLVIVVNFLMLVTMYNNI